METRITNRNMYQYNQGMIKRLQKIERRAWTIFIVLGLGYIVATILLNH